MPHAHGGVSPGRVCRACHGIRPGYCHPQTYRWSITMLPPAAAGAATSRVGHPGRYTRAERPLSRLGTTASISWTQQRGALGQPGSIDARKRRSVGDVGIFLR